MTRPNNPYVSQGYGQHNVSPHGEHTNDLDSSKDAHHHSIGRSSYQASSGLHTHDGVDSEPVKYTDITGLPVIPTLPVTSEVEVFRVENQNANNAGWTGIGFTQTVVANGSALSVSPTNNGIVINTAGRYLIHAAASISPNTVGRRGITVHTGSPASFTPQLIMPALPSGGPGLVFSTIYNCSPGAQYTVYLFQDSGATLLASNVRFSMYLLY